MRSYLRVGRMCGLLALVTTLSQPEAGAQDTGPDSKASPYSITLSGEVDDSLAPVAGKLTTLFYECYPKLVGRFENPKRPAPRSVQVVFKKGIKVPAYASGNTVTVSMEWLQRNPNDVGLLTHELTHVVQAYPRGEPGWLTEGIADYARQVYGPKDRDWALPERLTKRNSYKDSYRVTAKFLVWLEEKHPGSVDKLHRKMQNREFALEDFKTITGSTVDALWDECVKGQAKK